MEVVSRRSGAFPASLETLKLGKNLGKGGFAVVKSGWLRCADGAPFPVAVKVLHPEYSDESSQELRLFKEEAELMLKLDHRNIITAYGLLKLQPTFPGLEGHEGKPAYALVLELMEGGSLARLMVKQLLAGAVPKYTFSQALGWLIDVARALQYLHVGGKDGFPRIHRDVKLENVLLTAGMRNAKLADFGLQRAIFAQQPEHQQQQAMLVRRSMRPSITQPLRTSAAPAGLSRLAPESERSSQKQGTVGRLQSPHSTAADPGRRSSPSGFVAAETCTGSGDEFLPSDTVFFCVDNNGLTPLVLPKSPQQQPALPLRAATSPEAAVARAEPESQVQLQSGYVAARTMDKDIARRSQSATNLDQVGKEDSWKGAFTAVASSARDGAATAAPKTTTRLRPEGGAGVTPSQLRSAMCSRLGSTNDGSTSSLLQDSCGVLAPAPPSPMRPGSPGSRILGSGPSQRSFLLGAAGNSPSYARPSPLGLAQAPRRDESLTDTGSRLEGDSLADYSPRPPAAGGGPSSVAAITPQSPSSGAVITRGASASPNLPCTPTSPDGAPGAAGLVSSASVPALVSSRQSASGLTPTASTPGVGSAGVGSAILDAAQQLRASLLEVLLESGAALQTPVQPQPAVSTGCAEPPDQDADVHPRGATNPPAGAVSGGEGAAAAAAAAATAAATTAPPISSGRVQVLTGLGAVEGGISGASGELLLRAHLPSGRSCAVPKVAVDCAAKVECGAEMALPDATAAASPYAPRVASASGMVGSAACVESGQGSAVGRVAVSSRNPGVTPLQLISGHADGGVCAATAPAGWVTSPAGSAVLTSNPSPQQQQQNLHMSDMLLLKLGAQNISVRSVRSSASGLNNRQMGGSAPGSPRLAAVAAATRAVAAGVTGSQQEAAASMAGSRGPTPATARSAAGEAVARSHRPGSLPGVLPSCGAAAGAAKAAGQGVDYEEVFALTGRTGSLMYLAPEAYKNEPYNDKVDVYSLAVLMYELFGRTSITYTHISTKLPAFSRMLCNPDEFAERVAAGYRPPRTNQMEKMPPQLWELIEASWHQDPVQRPDIGTVLAELEGLVEPLAEAEAGGGSGHLGHARCGCVIC